MSATITAAHRSRRAMVYVRQSTTTQMFDHQESTRRQYALADRAISLGWSRELVEVVDEDQGRSGASTDGRTGFARIVRAVAQGIVGAVFALEVSRLARSSDDWRRLLALCAVAMVLVIDEQTAYDPALPDDRLLLDLKGTMSEAELHWLGLRLTGARIAKARRGALRLAAPTGYVWTERGLAFDPDESVRTAIEAIFARYAVSPSAWAVVRWARTNGFRMPTRNTHADGTTEVTWKPLGGSRVHEMLTNPIYAGAYVYGRRPTRRALVAGEIKPVRDAGRDASSWRVLLRDAHPGYITWMQYEAHQSKLRANATRLHLGGSGAPREGPALLGGLAICGRCGRHMRVAYQRARRPYWIYVCPGDRNTGQTICWTVPGMAIDAAVTALLLATVVPREIDLSLAVLRSADEQSETLSRHWALRVEQSRYAARSAERRYKAVDPDNRVVARTLEREWEERLREVAEAERAAAEAKEGRVIDLSADDRERIRTLARDLPVVWNAATTAAADRKAMLRLVIETVALVPIEVPRRATSARVQWRSGVITETEVPRWGRGGMFATTMATRERVRELANDGLRDDEIATQLTAEGLRTARGGAWTIAAVKWVRRRAKIARTAPDRPRIEPLPDRFPDGRYSITGAAKKLRVSVNIVRNWINAGRIRASAEPFGTYKRVYWISLDEREELRLARLAAPAPRS